MSARTRLLDAIAFSVAPARRQARLAGTRIHQWTFPDETPAATFNRTRSGYAIRFPGLADFSVAASGERVECQPVPGTTRDCVEQLYLNQVVPLALSRAGHLVFHASAVDVAGRGVAFMGASGRGKSTLAATFATAGHGFLADDGLLLAERRSHPWILPSAPSLRLWDDSRAALLATGARTLAPAGPPGKSKYRAGKGLAHRTRPLPLAQVYFLGPGRARRCSIEPLPRGEAVIELVRHSFLIDIEDAELLAAHFAGLAALASKCAFYRIDYPRRFASLPAVREAILGQAA